MIGELVPKSIAYANPESTSRWLVRPLRWFAKVALPVTWLLNGAANALLKLLGVTQVTDSERAHSPEELRLLVMQTRAHGMLNESDAQMLAGVFDFHQKKARDVMRPRTEIVAIPATATQDEVWAVVRQERYSRYPIYGEDLDDLIGVFLAKDLWLYDGKQPFTVQQFVREALYIPDSRPAERVLDDLRKTRAHMAIVLDEFGGTAGIVTMEDLVEEVIGDIADEYDVAQREALGDERRARALGIDVADRRALRSRREDSGGELVDARRLRLLEDREAAARRRPRALQRAASSRWWRWTRGAWPRCACTVRPSRLPRGRTAARRERCAAR